MWKEYRNIFNSYEYNWDKANILANNVHKNSKNIVNTITIGIKYFIFQQKCLNNKITPTKVKRELCTLYEIEKFNAENLKKEQKMVEKWKPVLTHLYLERVQTILCRCNNHVIAMSGTMAH